MTEEARTAGISFGRVSRGSLVLFGLVIVLASPLHAQERSRVATTEAAPADSIDLQGHRGARGLLPENSVPSVLRALDLGVETVELDVVVTSDRQIVVSHEPWMSSIICRSPDGEAIAEKDERSFNLFLMEYDEVAGFDCGSRGHPTFPDQRPTAVSKPLLRDVVRIADGYAHVTGRSAPRYNIEIKSVLEQDGIFHPVPEIFARLVYDLLAGEDVLDRTTVQSFDPRSLVAIRAIDPTLSLALLVANEDGFEVNVARLGFTPHVYSPHHLLVDDALMEAARAAGVGVVPWTVNDRSEMTRLLRLGVRGLITDYPDVGREAIDTFRRLHD